MSAESAMPTVAKYPGTLRALVAASDESARLNGSDWVPTKAFVGAPQDRSANRLAVWSETGMPNRARRLAAGRHPSIGDRARPAGPQTKPDVQRRHTAE